MITKFPSALRVSAVGALVASLALTGVTTALAASPKAKKDSASAALVPAKYKSGLKVATDASYPPDEFVNAAGKIVGFDVELINAIGVTLGVKVTTQNVTFDNIIPGIKSGKYAIGNSSFTDTKERQKSVNFVDYFKAGEAFYTKSSTKSAPKTLADLCGSSVAVESGTIEETDAKAQKAKCTGGKTIRIDSFATQTEADLAVKSGRAVVGFADSQVAGYIVAQSKGAFKLSGRPFGVAPYGIATARTTDGKKLALAIQSAIRVLIDNGVYNKILAKYGETSGALKKSEIVLNGGK
jgi:polar amino acid transport system substrate-binding protein